MEDSKNKAWIDYRNEWDKVYADTRLTRTNLALLLFIRDRCGKSGWIWYSQSKIAAKLGVKRQRINESIKKLEKCGYIILKKHKMIKFNLNMTSLNDKLIPPGVVRLNESQLSELIDSWMSAKPDTNLLNIINNNGNQNNDDDHARKTGVSNGNKITVNGQKRLNLKKITQRMNELTSYYGVTFHISNNRIYCDGGKNTFKISSPFKYYKALLEDHPGPFYTDDDLFDSVDKISSLD